MNSSEAKKLCEQLLRITKGSEVKELLIKNKLWDKKFTDKEILVGIDRLLEDL